MTTLAEIEAAAATLSAEEQAQLEAFLRERRAKDAETADLEALAHRNGFFPLPRRSNKIVTIEMVRQLCEEEGI